MILIFTIVIVILCLGIKESAMAPEKTFPEASVDAVKQFARDIKTFVTRQMDKGKECAPDEATKETPESVEEVSDK